MDQSLGKDYPQEILPEENHLRDYWQVIMKYRWTMLTIFIIIVMTVAVNTFKMTPIYKATAKIQIEKQNPKILSIEEVVSFNDRDDSYYQTQYKILESRPLAKAVINELDLKHHWGFIDNEKKRVFTVKIKGYLNNLFNFFSPSSKPLIAQTNPSLSLSLEERKKRRESLLIDFFLDNVQIEPVRKTELVNINFLSKDPDLARKIANTIAEQYIQRNLNLKHEAALEANNWLNHHIGELKKKLETSEEALHTYKEKNKIVSLEEKQNIIVQKLSDLSSAVTEAKKKSIGLETLYKQIKGFNSNKEAIESLPAVINNSLIQGLKIEYISLVGAYNSESKKYGPKHLHIVKIASRIKTLEKRIASEVKKIINSIKIDYEVALAQEKVLLQALEEQKKEALELNKKAIKYNVLKRDTESNKQMFEVVLTRLKETDLTRGLKTTNVRIIERAEVPKNPVKPNIKSNLIQAALAGLFIGVIFAFFLEYLDNTIKTPEDVKRYLGIRFLGPVPHFNSSKQKDVSSPELITLHKPKSHTSEAYKGLRTNILFSFPDNKPKTILVTSANPMEGKTITSVNLAVTMAQSGAKVVLIDCDMRKPRLHHILKLPNDKGVSSLIIGQNSLKEVLQEGPIQNLSVIPCGHRPPNPSELLASPNLKKILDELKIHYDLILIDSPPVVPITDSVIISRLVDGVILVLQGGATSRDVIIRGRDLLLNANAHIIGTIINNIDLTKRSYYHYYQYYQYYYYQYYGDNKESSKKRRKKKDPIISDTSDT